MAGDDVLAAWQQAGTDEVMLPTGTEVQLLLPGPAALARTGMTPGILRDVIGRLTGNVEQGGLSDEDWARWSGAIRILISEAVIGVRTPGSDIFAPWAVTPEALAERRVPPVDADALTMLVLRLETPEQVDARSRAANGSVQVAAAARAWARNRVGSLPEWTSFIEGDQGLMCALTARTFGQRPSTLLGVDDPVTAYAVDEALMMRLALHRAGKSQPLPPDHYERPAVEAFDPAIAERTQAEHLALLRAEGRLREH